MTYFSFILFSILEQFSLLLFGFSIFRIRLSFNNYLKMILLTIITSTASIFMTYYSFYEGARPIVIFVITLLLINKVKKIGLKTSLIIVPIAYIIFIAVQTLLFIIMNKYDLIPLDIVPFSYEGYLLQFITSIFFILLSIVLRYFLKEGFMFDPESNGNKKLRYSNKLFLIVLTLAFVIISGLYYEAMHSSLAYIVYAISIISLLFSIGLFYLSVKRDQEEAELYFSTLKKGGDKQHEESH